MMLGSKKSRPLIPLLTIQRIQPNEYILNKRFLILTFLWKLKFPNNDMFASQGKIYRMPLGLVNLLKAKGTLLTDTFST